MTRPITFLAVVLLLAQVIFAQCPKVIDPTNPNRHYDLNPLSNAVKDYLAPNLRYPSYTFFINVCRPLVHVDAFCPAGTGICEITSFSSSDIGQANTAFTVISEGILHTVFPSGAGCFSGEIDFTCNPSAGIGQPIYVSETCLYAFKWETEHACPKPGNSTENFP